MTAIQKKVAQDVNALFSFLEKGSQNDDEYLKIYDDFLRNIELLNAEPQGGSLATASCIPIWELLNYITSQYAPKLPDKKKSFILQLFCGTYMKSKDRRSSYQSPRMIGDDPALYPSLVTHVPFGVETIPNLPESLRDRTGAPSKFYDLAEQVFDPAVKDAKQLHTTAKLLLNDILPHCVVCENECAVTANNEVDEHSLIILVDCDKQNADSNGISLEIFSLVIWVFLIHLEFTNSADGRDVIKHLTSSAWASKMVHGGKRTVGSIFTKLTDASIVIMSVNDRVPANAIDNTPIVDPHIARRLNAEEGDFSIYTSPLSAESCTSEIEVATGVNYPAAVATRVEEILLSDIPSEIEFSGTSSACRYPDSLTAICRGLLNGNCTKHDSADKMSVKKTNSLLFGRKRGRNGDGPSLVPDISVPADELQETVPLNTLERIVKSWQ